MIEWFDLLTHYMNPLNLPAYIVLQFVVWYVVLRDDYLEQFWLHGKIVQKIQSYNVTPVPTPVQFLPL